MRAILDSASRHVFSQDFQNQAIPGQETKAKSPYSSVDPDEKWQQNQVQLLREDTGGERSWVCKDSHNGKTEGLYWTMAIDQSYQMEFNI